MGAVTPLPFSRPLTRADLEAMPDDGHRYELVDGTLVVTPAPSPQHQMVAANLFALLRAVCPPELVVLFAPVDVVLSDRTVVQPDLLVAGRGDFTSRDLPTAPLLAVEVLSESTEHYDRMYDEVAKVTGDEVFRATRRPFGVEVRPADLIL